jgi:hypothetical protein
MITFNESRLHFTFDDTAVWQVVMKVDGHTDYKKTQVMQSFKIVDFACVRNNEVMFVEAKNYTGHSLPANIDRLINDIASKVKDTICCAVAANLNSTSDQINWNRITTELSNPNVAIKVVFWMEDGYPNTSRARAGANIYGNKLKQKLTWLTNGHNVLVANTHIGGVQGLVVA